MPVDENVPKPVPPDEQPVRPVSEWKLIGTVILMLLTAIAYLAMYSIGPEFERLFAGFGADTPLLTEVVIATYTYYGLFLLIGFIPCVLLFRNRSVAGTDSERYFMLVAVGFGLSLALLALFVIAMYAPIFKLGAAVG